MEKELRNELRNVITKCRKLLEDTIQKLLEGQFGIHLSGEIEDLDSLNLPEEDREYRAQVVVHLDHIKAGGFKQKDATQQLVREVAFTHLNRLCAFKMMEERELLEIGGRNRRAVSQGIKSQGFIFYLADHLDDEKLWRSGQQDVAYRHFLAWLGSTFADEIKALFSPNDPAGRLFPPQRVLDQVLELINSDSLKEIWKEDETIGWIYQYFTPKELRDQARKDSPAPRNSYELGFRNQFYTPSYVVQFLSDNTLGRIWYEMRQGQTRLKQECRYLVCRPNEKFLTEGANETSSDDSETICIPYRAKKDPRHLNILDPAGGSGHFLLYCFGLFQTIYDEAWDDPELGPELQRDYPDLDSFRKAIPGLILRHNLHCIDIDLRASQIAALALWLRAQRAYQELGLKRAERPPIMKSNIVCAEPMPGEAKLLEDFAASLRPSVLGDMVRFVFEKMKLAGEAGSLLKIEEEISRIVAEKKRQYKDEMELATDKVGNVELLTRGEVSRLSGERQFPLDFSDITDEQFWETAEERILEALRRYSQGAANGHGLLRQLFAEDAERGFAFVDICRKRFDVVLMNPPFGDASEKTQPYLQARYPEWNFNLFCCFVARALTLAEYVGAITDRAYMLKTSYEDFRRKWQLTSRRLAKIVDLGWGVLDANVEVNLQVFRPSCEQVEIIDLSNLGDKKADLLAAACLQEDKWLHREYEYFLELPNAVLSYRLPAWQELARKEGRNITEIFATAKSGLKAGKVEQFVRLLWEVPEISRGTKKRWNYFQNGSPYAPYHYPTVWVIHYEPTWQHIKVVASSRITGLQDYWRPGLTYGKRTDFIYCYPMAKGQVFSNEGMAVFPNQFEDIYGLMAFVNSPSCQSLMNLLAGQHKAHSYFNKMCLKAPIRDDAVSEMARTIVSHLSAIDSLNETSMSFTIPFPMATYTTPIDASMALIQRRLDETRKAFDTVATRVATLLADSEKATARVPDWVQLFFEFPLGAYLIAVNIVSYSVGAVLGRWDIRFATGERPIPELPDPFTPLPVYSPGMLTGEPRDYPLSIDRDGILPDDPDHGDDIVRRIHNVFALLWRERAELLEQEACAILGVKELRDYFRKPAAGGFWADHIARYSKSRRKAPIYWLLQSARKSYGLWLYYHRLDRDTLSKVLINYVEPKLRLEENRLAETRTKRAQAGRTGSAVRTLDRQIERQEEFLSELRDFSDKLRRAADLHLDPDLNDGVVLNIAPLWELVPWKEAKKYWDELKAGKYEWSSIAKQLKAKWPMSA